MTNRTRRQMLLVAAVLLIAGGSLIAGRLTANSGHIREEAYHAGDVDGYNAGYFTGVQDGVVQGRQEGRVLQEVSGLPANSRRTAREAFRHGYAAGADDVFAGYDGGWVLSQPYVVTLERGKAPIAYRISSRTPVEAGSNYYLCATGRVLCQEARR